MALPRVPHAALPVGRPAAACLLAASLLLLPALARADHKPLTEDEQRQITDAITSGVAFLKKTQSRAGDWPRRDQGKEHVVGYTALPALTLLECGVEPKDPAIQNAATLLRKNTNALEETYDLALAILFLDRLGNTKDEGLIKALSARLIAGQKGTGGWGYKCPGPKELTPALRNSLLATLQKLEPTRSATRTLSSATVPSFSGPRQWVGCIKMTDWVSGRSESPGEQKQIGRAHV